MYQSLKEEINMKYYVLMNCIRMTDPAPYEKAHEYFLKKLRKYENEGAKILYGCDCFVVDNLIYELKLDEASVATI
jgi:hypothetical protein